MGYLYCPGQKYPQKQMFPKKTIENGKLHPVPESIL